MKTQTKKDSGKMFDEDKTIFFFSDLTKTLHVLYNWSLSEEEPMIAVSRCSVLCGTTRGRCNISCSPVMKPLFPLCDCSTAAM